MDADKVNALLEAERSRFIKQTPSSLLELRRIARRVPLGVASGYQSHEVPYPLVFDRAQGFHAWDLDDNRYLDLHAGFGANVFGHANPKIVEAICEQAKLGSHYAHPTRSLGKYAEELCSRFNMQMVRFANSGNEATMEALRLARAFSGKPKVIRFEGTYHGHHDLVMFSADPDAPFGETLPDAKGLIAGAGQEVVSLQFNDLYRVEQLMMKKDVGAVIIEPIMLNLGLIKPRLGFLEGLRELCDRYGAVLIWDQVKTGATVAWGGAGELFPHAQPDLHCFGKTVGGGLPVGVYGGRSEIMQMISRGEAEGFGTFNGNPLTVAAGRAALSVLDPAAYVQLEDLNRQMHRWCGELIRKHDLPAYASWVGVKGGLFWADKMPRNHQEYLRAANHDLADLAWLWLANRGVLMAPGSDEQWTLCLPMREWSDLQPLRDGLQSLAETLSRA